MATVETAFKSRGAGRLVSPEPPALAALFDLVAADSYYARPISLRHPVVFYEGHLPAFSLNTLVKKALGPPGIDNRLERLFARGIDRTDEASAWRSTRGVALARPGPGLR